MLLAQTLGDIEEFFSIQNLTTLKKIQHTFKTNLENPEKLDESVYAQILPVVTMLQTFHLQLIQAASQFEIQVGRALGSPPYPPVLRTGPPSSAKEALEIHADNFDIFVLQVRAFKKECIHYFKSIEKSNPDVFLTPPNVESFYREIKKSFIFLGTYLLELIPQEQKKTPLVKKFFEDHFNLSESQDAPPNLSQLLRFVEIVSQIFDLTPKNIASPDTSPEIPPPSTTTPTLSIYRNKTTVHKKPTDRPKTPNPTETESSGRATQLFDDQQSVVEPQSTIHSIPLTVINKPPKKKHPK